MIKRCRLLCRGRLWRQLQACVLYTLLGAGLGATQAAADVDAQQLVTRAENTLRAFHSDPDLAGYRQFLPGAKGVMIIPQLVKGGFIFGGAGGTGVLLGLDQAGYSWSMPAFFDLGSVSFGLQIGAEVAEVILLIRTERGMDAMYSTEFKLGADASVAVGPTGVGAAAATADVLAFSRSKGAYVGLTLEGALIVVKSDWNSAYYGRSVRPVEIIYQRTVNNPGANNLIAALTDQTRAASAPTPMPAAAPSASDGSYDLLTIQSALKRRGFDPGPVAGEFTLETSRAIKDFQASQGIPITGQPSLDLQRQLAAQ